MGRIGVALNAALLGARAFGGRVFLFVSLLASATALTRCWARSATRRSLAPRSREAHRIRRSNRETNFGIREPSSPRCQRPPAPGPRCDHVSARLDSTGKSSRRRATDRALPREPPARDHSMERDARRRPSFGSQECATRGRPRRSHPRSRRAPRPTARPSRPKIRDRAWRMTPPSSPLIKSAPSDSVVP